MKIDIPTKRILFLGYGAVAKCVWNYFDVYITCSRKHVTLVDKSKDAFYGPNLKGVRKLVMDVNATNVDELVDSLHMKKGDVIIDLTSSSATYYFIKMCFQRGFHYINTSIEDDADSMLGTSIDFQQQTVGDIAHEARDYTCSTILTECGQNPGLIQHYVLYALQTLSGVKTFRDSREKRRILRGVIRDYQIGTILMSEIDNMKTDRPPSKPLIYNTWSSVGFLVEALDKTELVYGGKDNTFVKPMIPETEWNTRSIDAYRHLVKKEKDYQVLFLNETALRTTLNSICPILDTQGKVAFTNYRGRLIHHGEVFELARYFGKDSPFMSYVYQNSPYMDQSLARFVASSSMEDLWLSIHQEHTCHVFDNIKRKDPEDTFVLKGHDSIGCTIFCGEKNVNRVYWCGSILSDTDKNVNEHFTPTVIQVAAGVLSGLSYLLEKHHDSLGWIEPIDIDTEYMLEKSIPLLGKFFFTEIPVEQFSGSFEYTVKK